MKKFTCLCWTVFDTSIFTAHRFVHYGPAEIQDQRAAQEQQQLGERFDDDLKDVKDAKDAVDRAARLEDALHSLDAKYADKGAERIGDGEHRLSQLLDAMGVKGKDKKDAIAQYQAAFTTETGKWNPLKENEKVDLYETERTAAEGADKKAALTELQGEATVLEQGKFDSDISALNDQKTPFQTKIEENTALVQRLDTNDIPAADTAIAEAKQGITAATRDGDAGITTALDELEDWADDYGLGNTGDLGADKTYARLAGMTDIKLKKAIEATHTSKEKVMYGDGFSTMVNNELTEFRAKIQKVEDAETVKKDLVAAAEAKVTEKEDIKQQLVDKKTEAQGKIADAQQAIAALDTQITERTRAFEATKASIADGTYKESVDDKTTLDQDAQVIADTRVTSEELAAIDKYRKLSIDTTKTILRAEALKQLDTMRDGLVAKRGDAESAYRKREITLGGITRRKEEVLSDKKSDYGITGREKNPEEMRTSIAADLLKDDPKLKVRAGEGEFNKMVDRLYDDLQKAQTKWEDAKTAQYGGDSRLKRFVRQQRDLDAAIAVVDRVRTRFQA